MINWREYAYSCQTLNILAFQEVVTPEVLYEEVVEVSERYVLQQEKCQIKKKCPVVTGTTGEKVCMAGIFMILLFTALLLTTILMHV